MKSRIILHIALLAVPLAGLMAQRYPCDCGQEVGYIVHANYCPPEGIPLKLSISRDSPGTVSIRLSCATVFNKGLMPIFNQPVNLAGYSVTISDEPPPSYSNSSKALFDWCIAAQFAKERTSCELPENLKQNEYTWTVALTDADFTRSFLTVWYRSNNEERKYWLPLALQTTERSANQPPLQTPASGTPAAGAPVAPPSGAAGR